MNPRRKTKFRTKVGVANMDGSKNSYGHQVQAYKQKLTKYESVIKKKKQSMKQNVPNFLNLEREVWARSKMRFKN